jgi:hypothetical protein
MVASQQFILRGQGLQRFAIIIISRRGAAEESKVESNNYLSQSTPTTPSFKGVQKATQ